MIELKHGADESRSNAQDAFNFALDARNKSDKVAKSLNDLNEKIETLLKEEQATPAMVRDLAEQVLSKNIHLEPDEIRELANKINNIVVSLTDSDKIISDSAADLKMANELEERANRAKESAIDKQTQAGKVVNLLSETQIAQGEAEISIEKAKKDIALSERDLEDISQITREAQMKAGNTTIAVEALEARLKQLQTQSVKNDFVLNEEIQKELITLSDDARSVKEKSEKLGTEYKRASDSLNYRSTKSKGDIQRAKRLLQRASELTADTTTKFKDLDGMESVYRDNDRLLGDLMTEVDNLTKKIDEQLADIEQKSQRYSRCST